MESSLHEKKINAASKWLQKKIRGQNWPKENLKKNLPL
jgi:hypothetical protein